MSTLEQSIVRLQRRAYGIAGARGLVNGLLAGILVLVAVVWLDLAWETPSEFRAAAWALASITILSVAWLMFRRGRRSAEATRLADALDIAAQSRGEIRSGWDLHCRPPADSPFNAESLLSTGLATLAVERATKKATQVRAADVLPTIPVHRSLRRLGILCAVLIAVALLAPGLAYTQLQRLLRPWDDLAPYSNITFNVKPGDTSVVYGGGLDITAEVAGPVIDRLELVIEAEGNQPGVESDVLPMFLESSGAWRATLARITDPARYFVRSAGARSARYQIEVITVPRLENVRVRIEPPAYTGQPVYDGDMPKDGVTGLRGTRVELRAVSNRPLGSGQAELMQGPQRTSINLATVEGQANMVRGEFVLEETGRIDLQVTDVAGQESQTIYTTPITRLVDQRPFIRFLQPPEMSVATPEAVIPVEWSAEDDFGISAIRLYRSLNDSQPQPMSMPLGSSRPRRHRGGIELPFESYRLEPGDVVTLFLRVEDNLPDTPQGFETPPVTIRVISVEEAEQMARLRHSLEMLTSKYRQIQRRSEGLQQKKEGLRKKLKNQPEDAEPSDDDRRAISELAAALREQLDEMKQLADKPLPYDIEKHLQQELKRLTDRLENAERELQRLEKRRDLKAGELAKALDGVMGDWEKADLDFNQEAGEPLELLEQVFPLIADQSRFEQIYERQKALAQRTETVKQFQGGDDPTTKVRMREMEREQSQIREDLIELIRDLDNDIARIPENERFDELRKSAQEFVEKLRASHVTDVMSEAESALAEFSGERGNEKAREAEELLRKLMGDGQAMGGQGKACLRFSPTLSRSLGNTIVQLLADMGLGEGGRGGFTSRANKQTGLFGRLPSLGRDSSKLSNDSGRVLERLDNELAPSTTVNERIERKGASRTSSDAPLKYRRRVGDYFQRIAEQLGELDDEPTRAGAPEK